MYLSHFLNTLFDYNFFPGRTKYKNVDEIISKLAISQLFYKELLNFSFALRHGEPNLAS